jgi:hypothetical protein
MLLNSKNTDIHVWKKNFLAEDQLLMAVLQIYWYLQ